MIDSFRDPFARTPSHGSLWEVSVSVLDRTVVWLASRPSCTGFRVMFAVTNAMLWFGSRKNADGGCRPLLLILWFRDQSCGTPLLSVGHGKNSARRRNAAFDAQCDANRRRLTQGATQGDATLDTRCAESNADVALSRIVRERLGSERAVSRAP